MSYPSDPYPFVCQAGHVRRIYVCGGVQNLKELEFNLQKGVTMELWYIQVTIYSLYFNT